jgi:hypothetical protein
LNEERQVERDAGRRKKLAAFLLLGGLALLLTALCPVESDGDVNVYLWDLFGIAPFVALMPFLCLPLAGIALGFAVFAQLDEGLLGAVTVILLLGVSVSFRLNPLDDLSGLGMWESGFGHQILLLFGVVACSVASRLRLYHGNGTVWAVFGSALLLGYLLTPNSEGWVPVAEAFRRVFEIDDGRFLFTVMEVNRALAYLIPGLLFFLVLTVVQRTLRPKEENRRVAMMVGWLGMGFLPVLAFPLLMQHGVSPEGNLGVSQLMRPFVLLAVLTIVLPNGFSHWILAWRDSGGRSTKPSLE